MRRGWRGTWRWFRRRTSRRLCWSNSKRRGRSWAACRSRCMTTGTPKASGRFARCWGTSWTRSGSSDSGCCGSRGATRARSRARTRTCTCATRSLGGSRWASCWRSSRWCGGGEGCRGGGWGGGGGGGGGGGEWLEEFALVRRANVMLVERMPEEAWERTGVVADAPVSARAVAYLMVGHERHHLQVVRERYL